MFLGEGFGRLLSVVRNRDELSTRIGQHASRVEMLDPPTAEQRDPGQ